MRFSAEDPMLLSPQQFSASSTDSATKIYNFPSLFILEATVGHVAWLVLADLKSFLEVFIFEFFLP